METYKIWFYITVSHEYYLEEGCPVSLTPAADTKGFFCKYGILFKRQAADKWAVLINGRYSLKELLMYNIYSGLSFELRPDDKIFYYLSGDIYQDGTFSVKDLNIPRVWKTIKVDLEYLIDKAPEEVNIRISSVYKYYEYIFIPKYTRENIKIKLKEERARIRFGNVEKIKFPGVPFAFRFVSEDKIKLSLSNSLKFQLWETRDGGERLISGCVPEPSPDECSVSDPKDVLASYFYY